MFKHGLACMAIGLSLMLPATAPAAEVAGVKLPDAARVGNADLPLNGAGLRTRFLARIYVGALYLPEKKSAAPDAIASRGAKRVALYILRDLSSEQLSGALDEGLNANLTPAEREKFKAQIDTMRATMAAVGAVKEKSVLTIDYVPEFNATRFTLDGALKGNIPGEEFYRALMKIWLGDKPVDESLKAGMLGQG